MRQFYVHFNGYSVFVKEAQYFRFQGGLTQEWGRAWTGPLEAENVEAARRLGYIQLVKPFNLRLYNKMVPPP